LWDVTISLLRFGPAIKFISYNAYTKILGSNFLSAQFIPLFAMQNQMSIVQSSSDKPPWRFRYICLDFQVYITEPKHIYFNSGPLSTCSSYSSGLHSFCN
jgi:hypothetical protein